MCKPKRRGFKIIVCGILFSFVIMIYSASKLISYDQSDVEKRSWQRNELKDSDNVSNLKPFYAHLVFLIMSSPANIERRNTIRNTWLSTRHPNTTHFFVIATDGLNKTVLFALQDESSKTNDLIFLPTLHDAYKNLTSKVMASLKWLHLRYEFNYVFKADDDTFIRTGELLSALNSKPLERLYWGFFDGRANVKRSGQWAEHKWVLCDKYLPHARGGGYVLSHDLVTYIVTNAKYLQLFNSEDISVGAWLGPLDINRVHDTRFDTEYVSRGCQNLYFVTHKQTVEDMKKKWESLKTSGQLCNIEKRVRLSYIYNWKVHPSQCCVRNDSRIP